MRQNLPTPANNTNLQGPKESIYKDTCFRFVSAGFVPSLRTTDGQSSRKFSEIAVVILISLVALGAGNFSCCKPDEGNGVFFRSAGSHVLTKNYSVIAFRVFALDAIISVYGHVAHVAYLAALDASRLAILRCNQPGRQANFRIPDGRGSSLFARNQGNRHHDVRSVFAIEENQKQSRGMRTSVYLPDGPLQMIDYSGVVATVRECVRERGMARDAS
jgi:hypothetical protein